MTVDTNFLITGRKIRSIWRTEEEDFIAESLIYAKRNLSFLDYLASVAHAGNEISVRTPNYVVSGPLIHIGKDFFSIVSEDSPRLIHSFVIDENIEVDVKEKTPKAQTLRLLRHEKSFRSLLDDISARPDHTEVETQQGIIYQGRFEMFADCIAITENAHIGPEQSLVRKGTTIIPTDGIVSVLYAI